MTSILLVDDDKFITGPLAKSLQSAGYTVWIAHDGRQGLTMALDKTPNVVVLDVLMPEMDGWTVCKLLRQQSNLPILMLTALGDEVDRILGLELGADDYLTKPFSTRELIARLRALLRRVELDRADRPINNQLSGGSLQLDLSTRRVFKNGEELTLRYKEFELLSMLMSHQETAVTRAALFDQVWGTDWLGDTRTLDVHIRWLREKIEDEPSRPQIIQTVRSVGYRFSPDPKNQ